MDAASFLLFIGLITVVVAGGSLVYHGLRFRLPYAPSSKRSIEEMLSYVDAIESKTVLDLGSGTGDVLIAVAERGGKAIGIEINPFLVCITRARLWGKGLSDKVTVLKGNMFTMQLPVADVVILYTLSRPTARLAPKLCSELARHCIVISHAFPVPEWKTYHDSGEVKVYRVGEQAKH